LYPMRLSAIDRVACMAYVPIWPRPMKPHCCCLPRDEEKLLRGTAHAADRTTGALILTFDLIVPVFLSVGNRRIGSVNSNTWVAVVRKVI